MCHGVGGGGRDYHVAQRLFVSAVTSAVPGLGKFEDTVPWYCVSCGAYHSYGHGKEERFLHYHDDCAFSIYQPSLQL